MERGFLSSGDKKKKKEGVSATLNDVYPIINGIAKRVTNIDGTINLPKSILRKAVRNVVNDKHEVVKPAKDGGVLVKCRLRLWVFRMLNQLLLWRLLVLIVLKQDPSFLVVQQYVSNTWRKFGFERITRNDDGVYLFKFATKSGRVQVIEKGSWMIHKSPIILSKWSSSVSLKRGEVTKVLVWVKMYNVPVLAYSKDGLSLLGTQIGKPIMLDAFTSSMCVKSWGRISFARALIEIDAVVGLKKGARNTKTTVMEENDNGFTKVKSRKKNKGANFGGIRMNKGVSNLDLNTSNPFDVLNVDGDDMGESETQPKVSEYINSDLNENRMEASKTGSSKSVYGDDHKDKNISSPTVLKKWDVINEDDTTDDEDMFTSYGGYVGGGNQLRDEDFDFYEGYVDQVVDLDGALKEFRDFKLSTSGRFRSIPDLPDLHHHVSTAEPPSPPTPSPSRRHLQTTVTTPHCLWLSIIATTSLFNTIPPSSPPRLIIFLATHHLSRHQLRVRVVFKPTGMPPKRNSASAASASDAPAMNQAAIRQLVVDSVARHPDSMPPKRNSASAASASEAPAMTQAAIRQLVVDSVATALETQAATIANADNDNRNPKPREAPVARKRSYKEFMSCQPFNFKGSEGAIGLIRWFERTKSMFSCSNYTEDCKTEIQKMEDELYHLTVNGNDLKTYVRRFQELATLCPTMVSNFEKLIEAFIGGLS
nr:zinc knuckle CX2CX4HX4C [Tanacetum cinerariifolium]